MEPAMALQKPFTMLTDEEVITLRDEAAKRKQQERERIKQLPLWERGAKQHHRQGLTGSRHLETSKPVCVGKVLLTRSPRACGVRGGARGGVRGGARGGVRGGVGLVVMGVVRGGVRGG